MRFNDFDKLNYFYRVRALFNDGTGGRVHMLWHRDRYILML